MCSSTYGMVLYLNSLNMIFYVCYLDSLGIDIRLCKQGTASSDRTDEQVDLGFFAGHIWYKASYLSQDLASLCFVWIYFVIILLLCI